jgi:hypothetical protein
MRTAFFYHAGRPVCLGAEQMIADAIDHSRYQVEVGIWERNLVVLLRQKLLALNQFQHWYYKTCIVKNNKD